MEDRELLELAAKAIGLSVCGVAKLGNCPPHKAGGLLIVDGTLCNPVWNPLTDDGDALRLAVKLTMMIDYITKPAHAYMSGHVVAVAGAGSCYEPGFTEAATRRAIVRSAAEIGKGM